MVLQRLFWGEEISIMSSAHIMTDEDSSSDSLPVSRSGEGKCTCFRLGLGRLGTPPLAVQG